MSKTKESTLQDTILRKAQNQVIALSEELERYRSINSSLMSENLHIKNRAHQLQVALDDLRERVAKDNLIDDALANQAEADTVTKAPQPENDATRTVTLRFRVIATDPEGNVVYDSTDSEDIHIVEDEDEDDSVDASDTIELKYEIESLQAEKEDLQEQVKTLKFQMAFTNGRVDGLLNVINTLTVALVTKAA